MSLSVKIIDNDTGEVVVDEKEVLIILGAIGTSDEYTIDLAIAMHNTSLAIDTYKSAEKMLATARPEIERSCREQLAVIGG
jgi:hypothetical protein